MDAGPHLLGKEISKTLINVTGKVSFGTPLTIRLSSVMSVDQPYNIRNNHPCNWDISEDKRGCLKEFTGCRPK